MFVGVIIVSCVVIWCVEAQSSVQCASPRSTAFKFSINHHRNSSGHWIAEVELEHGGGNKDVDPASIDIEHKTTRCLGRETANIKARVIVPPRRSLEPSYEKFPGLGYYKLHTDLQTWNDARNLCHQDGAHLAIINSNFEFSVLKMLWDRHPNLTTDWKNLYAFVGVSDLQKEKSFVTIFGQPIHTTGYENWGPKEPNHSGHCVAVLRSGTLDDVLCDNKLPYFCEQDV